MLATLYGRGLHDDEPSYWGCNCPPQVTLPLIVQVENINDNPPTFAKEEYVLEIDEVNIWTPFFK